MPTNGPSESPEAGTHEYDDLLKTGLVPLLIGVTGHRDLVDIEIPKIRERVRTFLENLHARFPDRPLRILSPLAEGADRLVAEVALELGFSLAVPLPMPIDAYIEDFEDGASREEFTNLLRRADAVYSLPIAPGSNARRWADYGADRDRQYAQLGVFLCAHSHLLLAIWDGKPSNELGGTAQVIRFHHFDVMPGYAPSDSMNQQMLVPDDSDLVYHIVVSRNREGGAPVEGLRKLSTSWLTSDAVTPRHSELPERYARIFELTSRFNREARQHRGSIREQGYSLIEPDNESLVPESGHYIDALYRAADWLAIHFQQKTYSALRLTHAIIFAMGLLYILYADYRAQRGFILLFFLCLSVAYLLQLVTARGAWHSKFLEYRTLAEGLRVQFYWAVAGVTSESATKFAHDNFLQKQDTDLGWIRNVMRVAGIGFDVAPNLNPKGLAFVMNSWLGTDEMKQGQLSYFRRKIDQYKERSHQLDWLGRLIGVAVVFLLLASVVVPTDDVRNFLFVVLAICLLVFGLRQSYTHKTAEKELIKQYEFMYSIFSNARSRIDRAESDLERRRVLRVLGESALDEHAEWILRHRDRPLDRSGLWRMEA